MDGEGTGFWVSPACPTSAQPPGCPHIPGVCLGAVSPRCPKPEAVLWHEGMRPPPLSPCAHPAPVCQRGAPRSGVSVLRQRQRVTRERPSCPRCCHSPRATRCDPHSPCGAQRMWAGGAAGREPPGAAATPCCWFWERKEFGPHRANMGLHRGTRRGRGGWSALLKYRRAENCQGCEKPWGSAGPGPWRGCGGSGSAQEGTR